MTQTSEETNPVLRAAEQAAAAGDFQGAERLLRELLASQEATVGRLHPDVANTLNNLAIVCERLEKLDEAEHGYRRAHAIAVASLPPKHPFVATSLKNLVEFCKVRGVPIWRPPAAQGDAEPAAQTAPSVPELPVAAQTAPSAPESPVAAPWTSAQAPQPRAGIRRVAAIAMLAAAAVVVLSMAWRGSGDPESPSTDSARRTAVTAPPVVTPSPAPPQPALEPEPSLRPAAPGAKSVHPERVEKAPTRATSEAPGVTVLAAAVCSDLVRRGSPDWECTPIGSPTPPGVLTFYTRLTSDSPTTIEHRWYYAGRLHQTMRLALPAAQGSGFRTYSRNTVGADRAGEWKVEVRTSDGTVLREEKFVIR